MSNPHDKKNPDSYWANRPVMEPPPRTPEVVGVKYANVDCYSTKGISYKKPLCYECWKDFDRFEIFECERCHWFDEMVGELRDEDLCFECVARDTRGQPPTPIYDHAIVKHQTRYLYILKLDEGKYYVGQTDDLELRLKEHQDGTTPSTRGKNPRLAWFEGWFGHRKELNAEEDRLTILGKKNIRAIRRMIAEWQRPYQLLDLNA